MAGESSSSHSLPTEQPGQGSSSQSNSNDSSKSPSRPVSPSRRPGDGGPEHKGRGHRVKFTVEDDEELDRPKKPLPSILLPRNQNIEGHGESDQHTPPSLQEAAARVVGQRGHLPHLLDTDLSTDVTESPTVMSPLANIEEDDEHGKNKDFAALTAQTRGQALATLLGSHSAPGSRRPSFGSDTVSPGVSPPDSRRNSRFNGTTFGRDDIPLIDMKDGHRKSMYDESTDEDEIGPTNHRKDQPHRANSKHDAYKLVQGLTRHDLHRVIAPNDGLHSGQITPHEERFDDYRPPPQQLKAGILSALLKLYDQQGLGSAVRRSSVSTTASGVPDHHRYSSASSLYSNTPPDSSRASSGPLTPKRPKWYNKSPTQSASSLAGLIEASNMLASPGVGSRGMKRPSIAPRSKSSGMLHSGKDRRSRPRLEDEIRITVHIAEVLSRQKYIMKICRALMIYGAPTHRLEEYLRMTARVLEIDGQFLYIPGCMIISFDDANTHTTEVKLVKSPQGVDLGKLKDVHDIYKEVVHDMIGVEEATQRLDEVMRRKQKFNKWIIVFMYGCASACVGPFAFQARPIDMPICFALGCLLGFLQHVVAPRSDLYSNIFEISAAVLTSFLARALGSIPYHGKPLFCFSALAQSSIALILPGYTILCGSLELQSRSIVAGSVRMVYAIIYSLFLGFGITIGTVIYGLMDRDATSAYTCAASPIKNEYLRLFPFVPLFTLCLVVINQAKWKQAPVMLVISFVGYVVNFFSAKRFASNVQVANSLGALAIGVLGNTYSRLRHGVAAAALLPAIFVQVPSGLSSAGSLVSGLTSANQITHNVTGTTVISNGTAGLTETQNGGLYDGTVFNVGYGMIQVAIGITVGLFLSALIVYPFGKKRSGLFSF